MKNQLLNTMKTLLVAAGLCVGAGNAWADEIIATLTHTASSKCEGTAGSYTSDVDAEKEHVNQASFGNSTWQAAAYADFAFEIPDGQTLSSASLTFTVLGESRNARNTSFQYVNAGIQLDYTKLAGGTAQVNATATTIETISFPRGAEATYTKDVTTIVKAMIEAGQSNVIFKWTGNPGGGDVYGKGSSDKKPTLVITTADASSSTTYTVVCKAGDTTLKTYSHSGFAIGQDFTASDEELSTALWDNGKKYVYSAGNETKKAVADENENVITLTFVEASKYSYTIKASTGDVIKTDSYYANESVSYYYPHYLLSGNDLYSIAAPKSGTFFGGTFTLDADAKEVVVTYTKNADITDVVYLKEAEEIPTLTAVTSQYISIRCSNGYAAYGTNAEITTLTPGKYKVTTGSYASSATKFAFTVEGDTVLVHIGNGGFNEETSDEFIVSANLPIKVTGGGSSYALDFVLIQKTGDLPADVTKTITEAGWATYYSPYVLDFSSEITNLEAAYIVTGGADGVLTKKAVTGAVPAHTGLLLKGTGNVTIPVATEATFDVEGNKLEGTVDGEKIAAEAGYVLMATGSNGLGFYQNSNEFTLSANSAYLPAGFDASAARAAFFWFGDDATGIQAVENDKAATGTAYNLNGQRVAHPSKGLYIVGGKKVIVK